jgi:DNA-binding transcriptional MerR regulator
MGGDGLLIGEVSKRSGASRKALRLYEAAGILPSPRRTASGYRVYDSYTLDVLSFVRQAQRLGFTLDEIKEIVTIKRAGRMPCPHVRDLVRRKAEELDQRLSDLTEVRNGLRAMLNRWRVSRQDTAVVCPHIERASRFKKGKARVITVGLEDWRSRSLPSKYDAAVSLRMTEEEEGRWKP